MRMLSLLPVLTGALARLADLRDSRPNLQNIPYPANKDRKNREPAAKRPWQKTLKRIKVKR